MCASVGTTFHSPQGREEEQGKRRLAPMEMGCVGRKNDLITLTTASRVTVQTEGDQDVQTVYDPYIVLELVVETLLISEI